METVPKSHNRHRNRGCTSARTDDGNFERIVEWACMAAASARHEDSCLSKHRENLKAKGESEARLLQFSHWQHSSAFTPREKAALHLSEVVSLEESEESSHAAYEKARSLFSPSEMIRLTLAIAAVNDWINLHSESLRVLVVEDNPLDVELLRNQLHKSGMDRNVIFVSDGQKAWQFLTNPEAAMLRSHLQVVFLDIHLPGMNGVEFLRRLRASPETRGVPVVIMTSSNDPRDLEECQRLQVTGYVQKPITYSSFSHAVADVFHSGV